MVVPGLFSVFLQSLAELQHLQDTPLSPPCTRHLFGTNRIENMNEFARGLTLALLWRERNIVEPIPGQCPDGSHPTSFSFRVASFHFTTWSYCSYSSWTTNRCSSSDWYRCSAPSAQIRRPCSHKGIRLQCGVGRQRWDRRGHGGGDRCGCRGAVRWAITAGNNGGAFAIQGATRAVQSPKTLTPGTTHT